MAVNKTSEKVLEQNRQYRKTEKGRQVVYRVQKGVRERIRDAMLAALGSCCVSCGFSDKRALQVDHINGGGRLDRKQFGNQNIYYRNVIDSFLKEENKYQLLCANCNTIKRDVNKEYRKPKQII